jgi:hypothetical protein
MSKRMAGHKRWDVEVPAEVDQAVRALAAKHRRSLRAEVLHAIERHLADPPATVTPACPVEAAILALLAGPHDRLDLFAAAGRWPPGRGWIPYTYLTNRVSKRVPMRDKSRYNRMGRAIRRLERRGLVKTRKDPAWLDQRRIRWVKLTTGQ